MNDEVVRSKKGEDRAEAPCRERHVLHYIPAVLAGYLLLQLKEVSDWTTADVLQTSGFALIAMISIIIAATARRPEMSPSQDIRHQSAELRFT